MDTGKFLQKYGVIGLALSILILSRLFSSLIYVVIQPNYYLSIHTFLEFFSIIVSFNIALQCLVSYPYTKSNRQLFLGMIFLLVGAIDLMHTLTYKGMPFFNMTVDGARATYFWVIARITEGTGLVIYLLNWVPKKKTFLVMGFSYLITAIGVVILWEPVLPPLLNQNGGVTSLKMILEYFICLLDMTSIAILLRRRSGGKIEKNTYLINAFFMIFFSELLFSLYRNVYDIDNLLGHIYKVLGYAFILRSLLVINLKEPFYREELSIKRFNKVFQFAPVGLAVLKKFDNRYLEANDYFKNYLGLSDQELIGKTPLEVGLPQAEWQKIADNLTQHSSPKGKLLKNLEISLPGDSSTPRCALISTETIEFNGQECILVSGTDISELKRLQKELNRLDRLNLVGQMAAGIGHEIRNPMTTVRGYLQLMGAKPENIKQKPTIDLMIQELDRANSIITEFLSLARTKQTLLQRKNLNALINNLFPLIEADTYNQNKQISFISEEIPDLEINPNEITQLVLNLCRNGLEAMDQRGCLTLKTYLKGKNVVLSIEDQGKGIPNELLNQLGTPFITTKENGTGLGLAICYRIAESHHAKIEVNSSSNGTRFLISFPVDTQNILNEPVIA